MSKEANHVVPSKSGGWVMVKSNSTKASKVFKTKAEARAYAMAISRKEQTALYIHKMDGTVQELTTYGQDPLIHDVEKSG